MPAITATQKTTNWDASGSNSTIVTASITPGGADRVTLIAFTARAGVLPAVTNVSGCGLTWTPVGSIQWGSNFRKLWVYKGIGTPSTGAITVTFDRTIQSNWIVIELANVDLTTPVVQSNTNTANATSITVTLSAFAKSTNGTMGFFANEGTDNDLTAGSGFTNFSNNDNNGIQLTVGFRNDNDTSVDASKPSTARNLGGLAIELNNAEVNLTVNPGVQVVTSSIPAPTITAVRNVSVAPNALVVTSSVPASSVKVDVASTPSVLGLTVSVIPPSISTIQNAEVTPNPAALTVSLPTPTVTAIQNVSVTVDVQVLSVSIPAQSVGVDQNVTLSPAVQTITTSLPTPTVSTTANATVLAEVQIVTVSLPSPTVDVDGVTVFPSAQSLVMSVLLPMVTTVRYVEIEAGVQVISLSLPEPLITAQRPAEWSLRAKGEQGDWGLKAKILGENSEQGILTPDGQSILVGENEDEVLIYAEAFNNWGLKSKDDQSNWGLKAKVREEHEEQEILTPDGEQILVGQDENEVLIYAEAYNDWGLKARNAQGGWNLKTRVG